MKSEKNLRKLLYLLTLPSHCWHWKPKLSLENWSQSCSETCSPWSQKHHYPWTSPGWAKLLLGFTTPRAKCQLLTRGCRTAHRWSSALCGHCCPLQQQEGCRSMAFDMMGTSLKNGVYICVYMHSCLCVFLCTSMTQGYQCVCVPPSIAILWGNIPYFYVLQEPQRIEMED